MAESKRKESELPSGDPALLNRIAWARRWSDPGASVEYALAARKKALDGVGRRSNTEQGISIRTLGWQALWRGEVALSMEYCLQAEAHLPESEFPRERAGIYSNLGIVHYLRNRFDLAKFATERGIWLVRDREEDAPVLADLLVTLANVQRLAGERARAGMTLGHARGLTDCETSAVVDIATSNLLVDDKDAMKALEYAEAAVEACLSKNNRITLPYARSAMADCYGKLRKAHDALDQIETGLDELGDGGDMQARCMMIRQRANILAGRGNLGEAIKHFEEAGEIARLHEFGIWRKKIALESAAVLEELGDAQGAVQQHKLAWQLQNKTRVR